VTEIDDQLRTAAARGKLMAVNSLIAAGADVNAASESGYTPLICAAVFGRTMTGRASDRTRRRSQCEG
jgi:ankyrin repeat protein